MASFTPAGSGGISPSVSIPGVTRKTPNVIEVSVGVTETAVVIPVNTTAFQLKCRDKKVLTIGTVSSGDTFTLFPGCVWTETQINQPAGFTLYITSQSVSTVELLVWE